MKAFRALRHRSFALLCGGQTVSRFGDGVYRIALGSSWISLWIDHRAAAQESPCSLKGA